MLRMVLLALLLAAPLALAKETAHEVYLHEYAGGLHIVPEQINAEVGEKLTLTVTNQGQAPHNLVVCGDAPSPSNDCAEVWGRVIGTIPANESRPLTFTAAKAGDFEYWCYVPGHKGGGMVGMLKVTGEEEGGKGIPSAGIAILAPALAIALALVGGRRA